MIVGNEKTEGRSPKAQSRETETKKGEWGAKNRGAKTHKETKRDDGRSIAIGKDCIKGIFRASSRETLPRAFKLILVRYQRFHARWVRLGLAQPYKKIEKQTKGTAAQQQHHSRVEGKRTQSTGSPTEQCKSCTRKGQNRGYLGTIVYPCGVSPCPMYLNPNAVRFHLEFIIECSESLAERL